jgi:hypothetical protein
VISIRDRMTLVLADSPFASPGRKVSAMHWQLGYSETVFWSRVNHLIDTPEAEAAMPAQVRRLKALREARRAARARVA